MLGESRCLSYYFLNFHSEEGFAPYLVIVECSCPSNSPGHAHSAAIKDL